MFDKLYGKRINFGNEILIKKNCYSCDWSKQEEDKNGFSETLMCYCQPTVIACYTRHCRGCMYYKVDKEVNKWYDDYKLVEDDND